MTLRDHLGHMIYVACRHLEQCRDATETELMAIEEAVELIRERTPNLSAYAFRVNAIRDLIRERNTIIAKIGGAVNGISHELAKIGRTQKRTEVWFANSLWKSQKPTTMIVILP
jgi:hypothetical protein